MREQLYNIKLNKNDKISSSLNKFDSIVREYEMCDTAIPLTEAEKRSAFLKSIKDTYPRILDANLLRQQVTQTEMSFDEFRKYLLQLEATTRRSTNVPGVGTQASANRAQTKRRLEWQTGPHTHCGRCNKEGHTGTECPLKAYGLYFCYVCRQTVSHKGTNCPLNQASGSEGSGNVKHSSTNDSNSSMGDGGRYSGQSFKGKSKGRSSNITIIEGIEAGRILEGKKILPIEDVTGYMTRIDLTKVVPRLDK